MNHWKNNQSRRQQGFSLLEMVVVTVVASVVVAGIYIFFGANTRRQTETTHQAQGMQDLNRLKGRLTSDFNEIVSKLDNNTFGVVLGQNGPLGTSAPYNTLGETTMYPDSIAFIIEDTMLGTWKLRDDFDPSTHNNGSGVYYLVTRHPADDGPALPAGQIVMVKTRAGFMLLEVDGTNPPEDIIDGNGDHTATKIYLTAYDTTRGLLEDTSTGSAVSVGSYLNENGSVSFNGTAISNGLDFPFFASQVIPINIYKYYVVPVGNELVLNRNVNYSDASRAERYGNNILDLQISYHRSDVTTGPVNEIESFSDASLLNRIDITVESLVSPSRKESMTASVSLHSKLGTKVAQSLGGVGAVPSTPFSTDSIPGPGFTEYNVAGYSKIDIATVFNKTTGVTDLRIYDQDVNLVTSRQINVPATGIIKDPYLGDIYIMQTREPDCSSGTECTGFLQAKSIVLRTNASGKVIPNLGNDVYWPDIPAKGILPAFEPESISAVTFQPVYFGGAYIGEAVVAFSNTTVTQVGAGGTTNVTFGLYPREYNSGTGEHASLATAAGHAWAAGITLALPECTSGMFTGLVGMPQVLGDYAYNVFSTSPAIDPTGTCSGGKLKGGVFGMTLLASTKIPMINSITGQADAIFPLLRFKGEAEGYTGFPDVPPGRLYGFYPKDLAHNMILGLDGLTDVNIMSKTSLVGLAVNTLHSMLPEVPVLDLASGRKAGTNQPICANTLKKSTNDLSPAFGSATFKYEAPMLASFGSVRQNDQSYQALVGMPKQNRHTQMNINVANITRSLLTAAIKRDPSGVTTRSSVQVMANGINAHGKDRNDMARNYIFGSVPQDLSDDDACTPTLPTHLGPSATDDHMNLSDVALLNGTLQSIDGTDGLYIQDNGDGTFDVVMDEAPPPPPI